ncbi:hypothetical protein [Limosilactobacillus viscerum]|uniref:hypothetical protein n=1 Tax=Limosilactobacillus viscerum TaxID=2993450 RepID=UPI0024B89006|nr:hypothetical protein [Limosilactobacillus viscerum]
MDNKQEPVNEEKMSRKQYREQLKQQDRYLDDDLISRDDQNEGKIAEGRQQFADEQKARSAEEKTAVLKRKLNIAIIALIVAIIIVYLILFYVG